MPGRDDPAAVRSLVERLRKTGGAFTRGASPHKRAESLVLPDQMLAPESIRVWAAFDEHYPWPFWSRRSTQAIARKNGKLVCAPMDKILRQVCVNSVKEELAGDDEAIAYVRDLAKSFAKTMPGFGVYLEPQESPDRILWFDRKGQATVLWYDHDAFDRREPFSAWLDALFE